MIAPNKILDFMLFGWIFYLIDMADNFWYERNN